jgi:hypothetical protein
MNQGKGGQGKMEAIFKLARTFIWGFICVFALMGCTAAVKPTPEPSGIEYLIAPQAKLKKVTLYEGPKGFWWVDVGLQNASDKKQAFRVSVRADDWAPVASFTGGSKRGPLDPQKEETVKLKTLSTSMPKSLTIKVIPYP